MSKGETADQSIVPLSFSAIFLDKMSNTDSSEVGDRAVTRIVSAMMPTAAGAVPSSDDFVITAAAIYATTGALASPDEVAQRMALVHNQKPTSATTIAAISDAGRKWIDQQAAAAQNATSTGGLRGPFFGPSGGSSRIQGGPECTVDSLLELLAVCSAVEGADVFRDPVCPRTIMEYNQSTLGPYGTTIHLPMSLSVIRAMITERRITTVSQLESRIWHIAANCVVFNAPEGSFPHLARQFAEKCSRILRQASPQ
jgi:hypothetical protein